MRALIEGLRHFQDHGYVQKRELFQRLAGGQSPDVLFITCADSRIDPNLLTHSQPGDLFILRNAGNIVPPHGAIFGGEAATVEYAVASIGVQHIVVCGHSRCGAMQGVLHPEALEDMPQVARWLDYVDPAVRAVMEAGPAATHEERVMQLTQQNVLLQLRNLRTHPAVMTAIAAGELELHGWVYRVASGQVLAADEAAGTFSTLAPERPRLQPLRDRSGSITLGRLSSE